MMEEDQCNSLPTYEEITKDLYLNGNEFTIHNYGLINAFWSVCQEGSKEPIFKYYSVPDHASSKLTTSNEDLITSIKRRTFKSEPSYYAVEYNLPNSPQYHFDVSFYLDPSPYFEFQNLEGELVRYELIEEKPFKKAIIVDSSNNPILSFKYSRVPFKIGSVRFTTHLNDSEGVIILTFLTFYVYSRYTKLYKEKEKPKENSILDSKVFDLFVGSWIG